MAADLRAWPARRRRRAFLATARRLVPAIALAHPAGSILVPSDDLTVRPKLFLNGSRAEFVVLQRAVYVLAARGVTLDGSTFVDVGANLGTTSLAALRLHAFGSAVACEPDRQNAAYLRATAALNGFHERLVVIEAAVADRVGRASFARQTGGGDGVRSGVGRLKAGPVPGAAKHDEVEVVTLDALLDRGLVAEGDVGLLWMDAQGHEGFVLAGARRLLAAGAPVVSALRPNRLARAGCLESFRDIALASFESFVDLRAPTLKDPWSPDIRPIDRLVPLLAAPESTDVLLLP
jgi:FkbM family methyltransferase